MDRAPGFGGWPLFTPETSTTQSRAAAGSVGTNPVEGRKTFWGRTTGVINSPCPIARTERDRNRGEADLYQELKKQLPSETHNMKSKKDILSKAIQYISDYNCQAAKNTNIVPISLKRIGQERPELPNVYSGKSTDQEYEMIRKQGINSKLNELDRQVLIWEGNDCYPQTETKKSLLERAASCVSFINSRRDQCPTLFGSSMATSFNDGPEPIIDKITINPIVPTRYYLTREISSDSTTASFSSENSVGSDSSNETQVVYEAQRSSNLIPAITDCQIEDEDVSCRFTHNVKERKRRVEISNLITSLNEMLPDTDGSNKATKNGTLKKAAEYISKYNTDNGKVHHLIPSNINRLSNTKKDESTVGMERKNQTRRERRTQTERQRRENINDNFCRLDRELLVWEGASRYDSKTSKKSVLERAINCVSEIKNSKSRMGVSSHPVLFTHQPGRLNTAGAGFNASVGSFGFDNNQPLVSGIATGGNQPVRSVVVTGYTLPILNVVDSDFL
ncbi:helix-loop-helix domain-containing protein [Endozoicomonas lisbonensis]|uniref:BHLH domain-containing protein n=1 Tax=Endozoicomonas lisbonensis TaxID=3120522 RepID=A0ABV2SLV4_9GAMM